VVDVVVLVVVVDVVVVVAVVVVVVVVVVGDDPPDHLRHLPPIQPPLEDLGVLGVTHAPWVKRIYNDVYG